MPIHRLSQEASLSDGDSISVAVAYNVALASLHLREPTETVRLLIGRKVIEVFKAGERDPQQIADRVIRDLGIPEPYNHEAP